MVCFFAGSWAVIGTGIWLWLFCTLPVPAPDAAHLVSFVTSTMFYMASVIMVVEYAVNH